MSELFPSKATQQSTQHSRYTSIPTAVDVKTHLFGLPLQSSLTGETLSDAVIEKKIKASVSWLEHELDLYITPVSFEERHDWNLQHWSANFGMIKVSHSNVISIEAVEFKFTNDPSFSGNGTLAIPNEMIYFEPKDGMIRIVPASNATFSGWLYSVMGGYMLGVISMKGRIPGVIWVRYTVGFEQDKIPALISDIVEVQAALEILSMLSTILFPYASHSVSQDGLSHSTGSPGPQYLAGRIQQLQQRLDTLMEAARKAYTKKILIDWI